MRLLKIGVKSTAGLAHRFASLSESPDCSAALTETLVPPHGSWLFSGMFLLEMDCTGIVLLSTGFSCLSSRGYLFQGRSVIPFSDSGL